ncbi:MAG: TerB N-terminal domain-containing protein [Defluviitaleaceae bacterium]|nr:TerB N-terminal domain-containing protein [Defluviitaleaceae bacterium]MCL2835237.1 TerB N-terminal domain-containing protein [Defluviitaleaceae bacterium]
MADTELYTINLGDTDGKGEPISMRGSSATRSESAPFRKPDTGITGVAARNKDDYCKQNGKRPILAGKDYYQQSVFLQPAVKGQASRKGFYELALEYRDRTCGKTAHIPFMCYWPSYEYMNEPQSDWYFYLRGCLKCGEYLDTDLSYIFVYIYELIHQVGVSGADDGFQKLVGVWKHYRGRHPKIDSYLVEWVSDYIGYYKCDAVSAFALLEREGLLMMLSADLLLDYYLKNDILLPIELISCFCDYKIYESGFAKGDSGGIFLTALPNALHEIRLHVNKNSKSSFEKRESIRENEHIKPPFMRSLFANMEMVRLPGYPPFEKHLPFRYFITSIVKEFENQLRSLTKYKGKLKYPSKLNDDLIGICAKHARNAVKAQAERPVEINIDRDRLLTLIQDSDEVRARLLEGNRDYDAPPEKPNADIQDISKTAANEKINSPDNDYLPGLSPAQQRLLGFLHERGGSSVKDMESAFPGVLVGVEIDRINEIALDNIGDLYLIFEDGRWEMANE